MEIEILLADKTGKSMIGHTFGNMKVLDEMLSNDGKRRVFLIECTICGLRRKVDKYMFRKRTGWNHTSCTLHIDKTPIMRTLYNVYYTMLARCNNPNHSSYNLYGSRGIKCEWETFDEFYLDMSDGYTVGMSIDRIDNDKNYCKSNCRWATDKEQARNRRSNVPVKCTSPTGRIYYYDTVIEFAENHLESYSSKIYERIDVPNKLYKRWKLETLANDENPNEKVEDNIVPSQISLNLKGVTTRSNP